MQSNLHFFVVAPIHIDEKLYTSEKGTWEVHVLKWQQVAKCMFLFCHFQIGFSQFPVFDCCSNLWFRSYKFCLYKASCLLLRNGMKSSKLKVIGRCWRCFAILQRKESSKINFFFYMMASASFLWYIFMYLPLTTILSSWMSLSFKEKYFELGRAVKCKAYDQKPSHTISFQYFLFWDWN